MHFKLYWIKN